MPLPLLSSQGLQEVHMSFCVFFLQLLCSPNTIPPPSIFMTRSAAKCLSPLIQHRDDSLAARGSALSSAKGRPQLAFQKFSNCDVGDADKPATAGHGDVTADVRGEKPIQVVCRGLKGPKREKKKSESGIYLNCRA